MPRRPRPASRKPHSSAELHTTHSVRPKPTAKPISDASSESGSDSEVDDRGEGPSSLGHASEEEDDESDDAVNPDAPRIAQWQDEDDLEDEEDEHAQDDEEVRAFEQSSPHFSN